MILQKYACLKDTLKCKIDQWILKLQSAKKCFDMVSDFRLQQIFKKLPLAKFCYCVKEK